MNDIELYHGSRNGINGKIKPSSRKNCDFGKGFYMGTYLEQIRGLVCNKPAPIEYKVKLHLSQIPDNTILNLSGMKWAFFVLYNRGKLKYIQDSAIYKFLKNLEKDKNIIIGPIADDNMAVALQEYVNNYITNVALYNALKAIDYGIQYVAKTQLACDNISIIYQHTLTQTEKNEASIYSNQNRHNGHIAFTKARLKYRRQGIFFDELLEQISKNKNWIPKNWQSSR